MQPSPLDHVRGVNGPRPLPPSITARLSPLSHMPCVLTILALAIGAFTQSGCGTACGPVRTVPTQRLSLLTPSPVSYSIRVQPKVGAPIDTPVPPDGRVAFDVPVASRDSTILFLLLPVYHYPPPDALRVIRVMRGDRVICTLSAQDIGKLPTDANGYHVLRIE
jgi:hypothetical protein